MKKSKVTRSLLAACSIVALTAVMYGCVHNGGSDDPEPMVEPMPEPMPEPDPEPTDLETTQEAAMAAATAAKTASDGAAEAAAEAATATANLATAQTGAMAAGHAEAAQKAADDAMAAYMNAKTASDAAAAATLASVAGAALDDATEAQMAAEAAQKAAEAAAMMASEAAMMELMIDGTMKSVGDTTIDAEAPRSEVTSGSGEDKQITITGLTGTPMTTGETTNGRAAVDAVITTAPPTLYKSPMVNAAAREDLEIGKVVDSANDMARLQIITAYASTKSVKVYDAAATTGHMGEKKGTVEVATGGGGITTEADLATDTNVELTLRPVGMFYEVDGGDNDGAIDAEDPDTTTDPATQAGDTVGAGTKPKQVYSFVNTEVNGNPTVYVVLNETTTTTDAAGEDTAVYEYLIVDIHDAVNRDGRSNTPTGTTDGDESVFVTAALPAPKSYSHLHFGVWAGLGEAAKDGSQKIANLGIGFVQSIGDGMTGADMQNADTATYNGNWAATVQEAHPDGEGTIRLLQDKATITANFDKEEITAALTNLATLKGDITGNTFSGDAASGINAMHGLDADAAFTGSFSGGFYGTKNAEAGGIFDFASEGNEGGAFVGAFGGAKQADE